MSLSAPIYSEKKSFHKVCSAHNGDAVFVPKILLFENYFVLKLLNNLSKNISFKTIISF